MSHPFRRPEPIDPIRRRVLLAGLGGAGLLAVGPLLASRSSDGGGSIRPAQPVSNIPNLGPLRWSDENGIRTPSGFSTRVVARAGRDPTGDSGYLWHPFPDGGATFPAAGGGWIYVSNSEFVPGGVGALRFAADGAVVDAYPIQRGTIQNCAGGPTPWGTWLTCEEFDFGHVYECDPTGQSLTTHEANIRRALGTFSHEAATVDPDRRQLFLTEDEPDGGLYRFTPSHYPDLSAGLLEIAEVVGDDAHTRRPVVWHEVPFPNRQFGFAAPTRRQVPGSTRFDGGEGIWYHESIVYFTTKGDNRVWAYDTGAQSIEVIYDADLFDDPVLTGVDNVVVSAGADVLVAEDHWPEGQQIVALTPDRRVLPIVQVQDQAGSELAGPAFSPDGTRLYFSSQRGPEPSKDTVPGLNGLGITYEVSGPFFSAPLVSR